MVCSMNKLQQAIAFMVVLCLSACASNGSSYSNTSAATTTYQYRFLDEYFAGFDDVSIETTDEIFYLDKALLDSVKRKTLSISNTENRFEVLLNEIIGKPNDVITYEANANLTASQAWLAGTANCLSLSIMSYTLAKAAGFKPTLQEVDIPEYWTSRQGNQIANGHINLKVESQSSSNKIVLARRYNEIDFSPELAQQKFGKKRLTKQQVVALFYVNKGAEFLITGEHTHAYAYFKQALILEPNNVSALSNLGILYRREGLLLDAEMLYKTALKFQPKFLTAQDNLLALYVSTAREKPAMTLRAKLDRIRQHNPYYHQFKGDLALQNYNAELAIKHFKTAIRLDSSNHDFYFGLAKAYYAMGNEKKTKNYLIKAKRLAQYQEEVERYSGKLAIFASI